MLFTRQKRRPHYQNVAIEKNEGVVMCTQNGAGGSQSDSPADTNELIAALESVLAALDAAGEKMAAIHVSMALDALLGRSA